MTHEAILFFATFSAALMGVVPPGLINMTAAKISTQKGKANGIRFAIGASITVVLQAYIAVHISKYLYNNPQIIAILLKIAVVIFTFFAIYFFVVARKKKNKKRPEIKITKTNSFLKGLSLEALNILPIPYFCGLNAAWNVSGWIKFELLDTLIFVFAAGLGTFTMLYTYVVSFNKLEAKTQYFSKYADYILSALMLILVIITLIRIFYT